MSGTIYDEIKVNVSLGDIARVHSAANCFTISDEQLSKARNDLSRLREECDDAKAATAKANEECAEAICKMKAELNAANEAAEKLRKELDERSATIPAFPKMSEELAASFDCATKTVQNADNPPPLIASPDRSMILDTLKDIVHEVAVYFTKPTGENEEIF